MPPSPEFTPARAAPTDGLLTVRALREEGVELLTANAAEPGIAPALTYSRFAQEIAHVC